jgi:hypothetical protein
MGGENRTPITINFFGNDVFRDQWKSIGNLNFSHIIKQDGNAYDYVQFQINSHLNVAEDKYELLRRICLENLEQRVGNHYVGKKTTDINIL